MPGFFSLEAAKQEMGVSQVVETTLQAACQEYQASQPQASLRVVKSEADTLWHKLDHLLYMPVLGLKRASELYYYQGHGLKALYGFTYKYQPLEQFLGQLTRLQVGYSLAGELAKIYSQAWYPGRDPLFIFTDWHSKPHWSKEDHLSGAITMWGRVMPGTHQLLINGPQGHLLGGWNYPIDTRLPHVLVEMEAELADNLARPIAYNIFDSEGGGLPLAKRYEQAKRDYVSVLPRQGHSLTEFKLLGEWQPVEDNVVGSQHKHEAVNATWKDPQLALEDPRRLVLMRRTECDTDPTRVYAGRIPAHLLATQVPGCFRQRWSCQERRIRELVNGANLNVNYGYTHQKVPNRTQQRRWDEAQVRVETIQHRLADHAEALHNLAQQHSALQQTVQDQQADLEKQIEDQKKQVDLRQQQSQSARRCEQHQHHLERLLEQVKARHTRRLVHLQKKLEQHQQQHSQLQQELTERQTDRDAIDTQTLCRERDLEKDQIMLNLQVLLVSLHDWVRERYLAVEWRRLELDTATSLIYRKSGRVVWGREQIEVILDPYRHPEQQQAMEASCRRFNAAGLRWRDGRLLTIHVAQEPLSNYAIVKVPV